MRKLFLICGLLFEHNASCLDGLQEINEQVWKPFIYTYNNFEVIGFMEVHSKDVVRSPRECKDIHGFDEYYSRMEKSAA